MARSIYDLVYEYMDIFYSNVKLKGNEKKVIHQEIKTLLRSGWCEDELLLIFKSTKKQRPNTRTLKVRSLFAYKKRIKYNIIEQDTFYYHNDLRLTSPPPKRQVDYDSGKITIINEPYFLEMRASYSVEDIVKYYARQINMNIRPDEIKRFSGSFNWLLKIYNLETVLFMIDATVNMCLSEDMPFPLSPLDIQKYQREALTAYNAKKTEAVISGGNKIVRKKRVRRS